MLKKAAIVVAILAVILMLLMRFFLAPLIKNKLIDAVSSGSAGVYRLDIRGVYCNPITGFASFKDIRLYTDTVLLEKQRTEHPEKPVSLINLNIRRLVLTDARFYSSWSTKVVDLGNITVFDPVVEMYTRLDSLVLSDTLEVSFRERLPQMLCERVKSLSIKSFTVDNGSFVLGKTDSRNRTTEQSADTINCLLDSIFVDKNAQIAAAKKDIEVKGEENRQAGGPKALYAQAIRFDFKNYKFKTSKSPYVFAVGSGDFSSRDELAKLSSVSAGPDISDEEFVRRQKFRRGRFRLSINSILIVRIDLFKALHRGIWTMQTVDMNQGKVDVYVDKSLEQVPDKRMPNELIRNLNFYLRADSIFARNVDIVYHEKKPDGKGVITFDQAYLKITNFTNDSLLMSDAHPALIDANCRLMNAGKLVVSIKLPLLSRDFACSFRATLSAMSMLALNPLFEKDNLIIESGDLKSVQLQAKVQNGKASGALEAMYDGLEVTVIEAKGTEKKHLLSSIANLLLRTKNKKDESGPIRTGTIDYTRIAGDDFLRFLWRSARSGLLDILLPKGVKVPLPPDHPG